MMPLKSGFAYKLLLRESSAGLQLDHCDAVSAVYARVASLSEDMDVCSFFRLKSEAVVTVRRTTVRNRRPVQGFEYQVPTYGHRSGFQKEIV